MQTPIWKSTANPLIEYERRERIELTPDVRIEAFSLGDNRHWYAGAHIGLAGFRADRPTDAQRLEMLVCTLAAIDAARPVLAAMIAETEPADG